MRVMQREYRDLSFVPRWAIIRTIRQQSVAEHTFYVALYAEQLARRMEWAGDHAALMRYALYHDVAECFTSDVPGPVKHRAMDAEKWAGMERAGVRERFGKDVEEIIYGADDEIRAIVKVADGLDELGFLQTEAQLGNKAIEEVYYDRKIFHRAAFYRYMEEVFGWESLRAKALWEGTILPSIHSHALAQSKVVR
jgi:5'-deoxynucleotidase YfbR-like HD superfamily hydrolase